MPFDTELTRVLGIRVPVVQGGMQWVGYAELASAVSNAGGLGMLTALTQPTPEHLRSEIRRCRRMTQYPFGVNITMLPALQPPPYAAYARVAVEENVKIIETAGANPAALITLFKAAGCVVIHKCTSIRHAQSAAAMGVDFVSMDGFECAGHIGETDVANTVLLSRARQTLKVPFIASGGFADGQGLAAALIFGAQGINMGTRFLCTIEAPVHIAIKRQIVRAQETDTRLVLRRWRNTTRLFDNKVAREASSLEQTSEKFEDIAYLVSGKRGRKVFQLGDPEIGVWTAGQVMGLINDVPSVGELIGRLEREAEAALEVSLALFKPQSRL